MGRNHQDRKYRGTERSQALAVSGEYAFAAGAYRIRTGKGQIPRGTLRDELDALNRRTVMERKRLKEESLFFEKKMAILQDGFRQLEEDRKKLEKERRLLREEEVSPKASDEDGTENTLTVVQLLFRGVNNPLALRKRYRDLIKIFHPDNLFGDGELAGQINKEYLKRKQEERFW